MTRRLAVGIVAAGVAAGCSGIGIGEGPAVTIGAREIPYAELERFFASRAALAEQPGPALLSALLDEFVEERLLLIGADESGVEIPADRVAAELAALRRGPGVESLDLGRRTTRVADPPGPDPERLEDDVRDRLRMEALLETVILRGLEVSEEALRIEFEANRALYSRPESVTLSELQFDDRATAEAAAERLGGEASPEPAGDPVGDFMDIGAFRPGDLPAGVDAAVFRLEPGETTGVVETEAGYRILRVEARAEAEALPLEEVEDVVRMSVLRREADARMEGFLASLRARHPVTIHTGRLPFPYLGLLADAP